MGIDLDFDGMTYDELVEMKTQIDARIFRQKEEARDRAWKKVVDTIKDYIKNFDTITVYYAEDPSEPLVIDAEDDFSDPGGIMVKYW